MCPFLFYTPVVSVDVWVAESHVYDAKSHVYDAEVHSYRDRIRFLLSAFRYSLLLIAGEGGICFKFLINHEFPILHLRFVRYLTFLHYLCKAKRAEMMQKGCR